MTAAAPKPSFEGAGRALRDRRPSVVERWLAGYARSLLRVPRPVDLRELAPTADGIAEALGIAFAEADVAPGHHALREAEKRVAFAGGALGMTGLGAFDVAAFVTALRDVLVDEAASDPERKSLAALFDWFSALATEGYVTSREDAVRMRHRDALEKGTPVVMVPPELPAALLLGEPDRAVLEATFGRLLLSVVRVGARAVIVDGSGLMRPSEPPILDSLAAFAKHRKIAGQVTVVVSGLPNDAEPAWKEAAPGCIVAEHFEDAVEKARQAARHI